MNFGSLVASLPTKTAAIYTLERGKAVRHPYTALAIDVARVQADLSRWGIKAGDRVGIYAPNSYHWLVHDLALICLRAVSVPFTDDFAGKIDDALLQHYNIALLLISQSNARHFSPAPHIALMDGGEWKCAGDRSPPSSTDPDKLPDQLTLAFSSGSAGGLKGLVISREGVESTLPPIVEAIGVTRQDRNLLFLPMSNFQQRS